MSLDLYEGEDGCDFGTVCPHWPLLVKKYEKSQAQLAIATSTLEKMKNYDPRIDAGITERATNEAYKLEASKALIEIQKLSEGGGE